MAQFYFHWKQFSLTSSKLVFSQNPSHTLPKITEGSLSYQTEFYCCGQLVLPLSNTEHQFKISLLLIWTIAVFCFDLHLSFYKALMAAQTSGDPASVYPAVRTSNSSRSLSCIVSPPVTLYFKSLCWFSSFQTGPYTLPRAIPTFSSCSPQDCSCFSLSPANTHRASSLFSFKKQLKTHLSLLLSSLTI